MVNRNLFVTFGVLAVLLLSLGVVSAASKNGVILTVNPISLDNVTSGETYTFLVTVENLNGTDLFLDFETTGWIWNITGENITNETILTFEGNLTIPSSGNESVILKLYENNTSDELFNIKELISLSYSTIEILGCTDSSANNYDSSATTDDGSCIYTTVDRYCDEFSGEHGDLEITSFEITNNGKGDDTEWEYLDEIEIEVIIENTGNDNINDVIVEIMIKDEDDNTITRRKMDLDDDQVDLGRIKDDDEEIATFKIDELPIDLDEGTYRIYVRVYDEDDEDAECTSISEDFNNDDETYYEFEIVSSDDATVIVKDGIDNILASCGDENVEVRFMVYNIGDNDEEKVLVTLEDSQLDVYEKVVIDNLRDKKGKEVVFFISIPEELAKSSYELDIYTYYDYDDDEDELDELVAYGESSEEEGDDFSIGVEILSCKDPAPSITAALNSDAKVGEELVLVASVTNNGGDNNFVISVEGFEDWAELLSVEPQSLSIDEDGTKNIIIRLIPSKEGFQTTSINVIVDGETYNQEVSVNIAGKEGLFANVSNSILYSVSGIIGLLILISLVLITKVSRKSRKAEF